jgi:hypothetical protein
MSMNRTTPLHRPSLRYGFPALLAKPGCCGTRALRSDSPRSNPPAWLRYSAADQGGPKSKKTQNRPPLREGTQNTGSAHKTVLNPPLRRLGFPGEAGAVGCVCLRPKAEFYAAARFTRKTEGNPQGRCGWVAFFGLAFLGEARKVTCPPGSPGI